MKANRLGICLIFASVAEMCLIFAADFVLHAEAYTAYHYIAFGREALLFVFPNSIYWPVVGLTVRLPEPAAYICTAVVFLCVTVPMAYGTGLLLLALVRRFGRVPSAIIYVILSIGVYGLMEYLAWKIPDSYFDNLQALLS